MTQCSVVIGTKASVLLRHVLYQQHGACCALPGSTNGGLNAFAVVPIQSLSHRSMSFSRPCWCSWNQTSVA